jgi:hypothetical protein
MVPGGCGSQISRQSAREGGKVVSHTHRPPLPPRKYFWYSFLLEAESNPGATVRPEGLCQWKIPMTPSGIEPSTFRRVAQCLNQLHHRLPHCCKQYLLVNLVQTLGGLVKCPIRIYHFPIQNTYCFWYTLMVCYQLSLRSTIPCSFVHGYQCFILMLTETTRGRQLLSWNSILKCRPDDTTKHKTTHSSILDVISLTY